MNLGLVKILLEGRFENLMDKYNIGKETIYYKFLIHPFNKKTIPEVWKTILRLT